ncbi:MAG: XRE family transcriptional regulator [Bacteroidota bacterium]|jgi:transcriptional regulator with XRE-family HTH domain
MHYFSDNIRLLRSRKKRTQEEVSVALDIKRAKYNSYENGIAVNPPLDTLIAISSYFKMNIDTLIKVDLSSLSGYKLYELEKGFDDYMRGTKLRVLSTTVNSNNRENVELVNLKARAGYTNGYSDPEFISALPVFQLPYLSTERKYRAFQLEGDSMHPIPHGAFVIGEFIQNWREIKDGTPCVVITENDGIVFKIVENKLKDEKTLLLKSLNTLYEPYEVKANEVKEVWKFVQYMSKEIPDEQMTPDKLASTVLKMNEQLNLLKKKLK